MHSVALADDDLSEMRQRSEIAGSPDRTLRRNHGMHPGVEHRAQGLDGLRTDAAEAFGESVGAKEHHRAGLGYAKRSAHAACVRADQIHLKLANLLGG